MELLDQIGVMAFFIGLFVVLIILLGVWFAPLGCWSRLAKIERVLRFLRSSSDQLNWEIKRETRNTAEMLKIQNEILAELKKLNKEQSS